MTTVHFSEQLVRDATRFVLKKEYQRAIGKSAVTLAIALALSVALSATGVVSKEMFWGLMAGLVVAAAMMALVYGNAYLHNIRYPLRVFRNEGVGEVTYELSDVGCRVKYKGVEAILPWRLLRLRDSCGEYQVLGFGSSETYRRDLKEIADAMSRSISGPELLGFPIFCAVPGPRTRYVFIPPALLRNSPHVPAV